MKNNNFQQAVSEVPEGWKIWEFKSLVENYDSMRVPLSKMERQKRKGIYPYYGASGVIDFVDNYIFDGEYMLVSEDGENLRSRKQPINFIVEGKFWVNNHAHIIKSNENSNLEFLHYWFLSNSIESYLSGSVQPKLSQENLNRIKIICPSVEHQLQIASILSALDEKIELNRKMNKTLEEMGKALFKRWFVDFEFPNEQGKSYKSSGGEMVESELGQIPKGWKVGALSDEFDILMGQSPPGNTYNEAGDGLPFYQGRTDFGERYPTRRMYCSAPTRIAKPDDTLLSVRAPVGDINQADEECCIGRGVAAISRNECNSYTFYKMLYLKDTFQTYDQEGTVFGSISKKDLSKIEITIPPTNIVSKFESVIGELDKQIKINGLQVKNLTEVRNSLLPRLMSGKLRVQ
jgi:type I restriction enzyme S subunit